MSILYAALLENFYNGKKADRCQFAFEKNRFIKVMNWHGALQKAVGKCEILSLIHLSVVLFFVGN